MASMQSMKVLIYAYTGLCKKKDSFKKFEQQELMRHFFRLIFSKNNYEKIKSIKY
jgi:hypothetical protein